MYPESRVSLPSTARREPWPEASHSLATALPTIRATLDLPPGPDRAAAHRTAYRAP